MAKKKTKKKTRKKSNKKAVIKPEKPPVQVSPTITPMPTAGPKVLEFEQALDRQLAGEKPAEKKRGPGRPPNPPKEPEPERPELTIDVVAGVVKIPFELWQISQGIESLALSDKEAQRIAEPAKQLIEHYLPQIPVIAYAWVSLSVSSFWVMRSRLVLLQELRKQKETEKPARPAAPTGPGVIAKFPDKVEPEKIK